MLYKTSHTTRRESKTAHAAVTQHRENSKNVHTIIALFYLKIKMVLIFFIFVAKFSALLDEYMIFCSPRLPPRCQIYRLSNFNSYHGCKSQAISLEFLLQAQKTYSTYSRVYAVLFGPRAVQHGPTKQTTAYTLTYSIAKSPIINRARVS